MDTASSQSDLENVLQNVSNPRKRRAKPNERKRALEKQRRHSKENKLMDVKCTHDGSGKCKVAGLSDEQLLSAFNKMYEDPDKIRQDNFLMMNMDFSSPAAHRPRKRIPRKREVNLSYYVPLEGATRVEVCAKSFLSLFGVGRKRVRNITNYWLTNKNPRPENRGGQRTNDTIEDLKVQIRQDIMSYKVRSIHYRRKNTPHRKYLSPRLSIHRMWKMFKERSLLSCSFYLYYRLFTTEFNLGFGNPKTDVCSVCVRMKNEIKLAENEEMKRSLVASFLIHKRRARQFYQLLQQPSAVDTVTVVFDLMQNQELPKTNICEAFYSRQLWQYFLGIVHHSGANSLQSKEFVHFYTWGEHQTGRGANEVASALCHYLTNHLKPGVKRVRLFSDSCVGQNKNYTVLTMLKMFGMQNNIDFEYTFPVRGHSFMPPDQVFGRAEQRLTKHPVILKPEEYFDIFSEFGTVHTIDTDWGLYDFKAVADKITRKKGSFKISDAKVVKLSHSTDQIQSKDAYSGPFNSHTVLKRGQVWVPQSVMLLCLESHVKLAKKKDVLALLKAMGVGLQHPSYSFYKHVCEVTEEDCDPDVVECTEEIDNDMCIINEDPW